ncbi:hypothetical protein PINS_up011703 [Pythium insidiosum]|nr:hypothetical protein PINS_up011703 [Pythium insidiosum]
MAKCKADARFYLQQPVVLQREVLCGVAATLLQIPETVAFSYVANLDPLAGLYATGFFGVIVGLFGGVPSTVAGAAGALAVVMPQLTSSTGALAALTYEQRVQHLVVAVFLAGVLQLIFGLLELSRFFSLIPRTAHMGFLNGLAIMMFLSQKTTFQVCDATARREGLRFGECEKQGRLEWMALRDPTLWTTAALVAITALVMHLFPRVPRVGRLLPPTLVVAALGVGLEFGVNRPLLGYDVRTIGETSPLAGSLPSLRLPHVADVRDWAAVLSCAASLAAVGIFESIMTIQAVVDLTPHGRLRLTRRVCRRECVAQGVGNVVCGVFGAMGGCSMIGQSTGNVLNGARHRLSAVVCGLSTFAVVLFASPVMARVPVACLTGILLVIIAHTFHWPSLRLVWRLRATDALALVLVTALAAAVNLAVAVVAGVVWQSLVNAWTSGRQLHVSAATWETVEVETQRSTTARVLRLHGALQFSSVVAFRNAMEGVDDDPSDACAVVVLDLADAHVADFSATAALKELALRCANARKTLVLRHADAHAVELLLEHDVGWVLTGPHVALRQSHRSSVAGGEEDEEAGRSPAVATPRDSSGGSGPFHAM